MVTITLAFSQTEGFPLTLMQNQPQRSHVTPEEGKQSTMKPKYVIFLTRSVDVFLADKDNCISAVFADVVDECELLGGGIEALRDRLACHPLRIGSGDSLDQFRVGLAMLVIQNGVKIMLRLLMSGQMSLFDGINPPKPTLQVRITLVHHSDVLLSLRVDHIKLGEQASGFQLFGVFHPGLHEGLQLESWRIVVVIAEDRIIGVFKSSRRMGESSWKDVEIGHWLVADAVVWVDFADLSSDDVVGVLHIDALREARDHHQRISVLISRPGLVDQLVGNHILASFERLCYFFPVSDEHIPHSVMIVPQCPKSLCHRIAHVILRPRMLTALQRVSIFIESEG